MISRLWINPSAEVERAADQIIVWPVDPAAVGKYMRQCAFGAKFAVTLDIVSRRSSGLSSASHMQ